MLCMSTAVCTSKISAFGQVWHVCSLIVVQKVTCDTVMCAVHLFELPEHNFTSAEVRVQKSIISS